MTEVLKAATLPPLPVPALEPARTVPPALAAPQSSAGLGALEFSQLLNAAPAQTAGTPAVASAGAGRGVGSALPIVEGIQGASNHLRDRMSNIRELTSKANFTGGAADLLKMQLELVQLGFEIELTGKVVTRATQDIDQLSKLQ